MIQTTSTNPLAITIRQARHILWKQGNISDFLLDNNQKMVRDRIKSSKRRTHVTVFSRQSGKSFGALVIATELCLSKVGVTVCYIAPTLKQCKRIVKSNFDDILKDCPTECKPKYNSQESVWIFPNGSKIELYGFNAEEIEAARGPKAHMIIVDECGFMKGLKYGLRSVLYPKLNTTKGAMLLISTLPKSQGHEFWEIVKKAKYDELLIDRNIYDCPRYTKDDIDTFAEEVGGYDSVEFKREYLNIMLADEEYAVIPEANQELMDLIVKEHTSPPFFDTYVSMDIGVKDLTFILFSYYDFAAGKLIIQDELTFKGKAFTTANIAAGLERKERELWNMKKPYLRVADNNNGILLNDLNIDYNYPFIATLKDNKHAWVNQIRIMLAEERILINPKCKQLKFHLENATWNKNRTDYDRSLDGGHYDGIDALAYMIRNVAFNKNPYPAGYGMVYGDTFRNMGKDPDRTKFQQSLIGMFSTKK